MKRVAAFVDGFNLYHALENLDSPKVKWLDLQGLVRSVLKSDEKLVSTLYFTAYATWDDEKAARHKKYIRALELTGVQVILGKFKRRNRTCRECGARAVDHEEKRTDVNIATHLLRGAFLNEFDLAIVVSGDTDLIPAIDAVKELFPAKRVGILFPMNRHTTEMEQSADFSESVKLPALLANRLPDQIRLPSGKYLTPPTEWQ
ncbi:MAG: NYN domain-containing protein [Spirochaetales bacterium]